RRRRRGHVDIRRTIRHAVARGGSLIELQHRGRRPGKPDLVVLCDVSGSVARASDLLLTILAGAESAFARVTRFAFVDRLVPIDFVDGHVRPEGELDYHAWSDHGAALADLEARAASVIDRRTVLLILGDARNNRRPARADVLRRLASRARAVVWAVPEPRERWDTGDSALAAYAPSADLVLEATSLAGLLAALREAARP
ncbi:MAG: VWA domain-containing protein, partial [Thermodesulfobacteriota bacterium]